MGIYIDATSVREITGADTDLISDTDLDNIISRVEQYTEQWLNSKFTPTEDIDILDGNNKNQFVIAHNPLLKIKELVVSDNATDTTMNLDNISWYKESGLVKLNLNAARSIFPGYQQNIKCKYIYGWVEYSSTTTTTSADTDTGDPDVLLVPSTTDFEVADWVEVYGMDGNREVGKITAIDAGVSITVDNLVYDHESGSKVTLLQVPDLIKQFLTVEAGIYVAIGAIGSTYTFNASYSLDEFSVVKGVPYTHWREVVLKLVEQRKNLVGNATIQGLLRPRYFIH